MTVAVNRIGPIAGARLDALSAVSIAERLLQIVANFVPHPSKHDQALLLRAFTGRRVSEGLVKAFCLAREGRAALSGVIANRQDVIELLALELVDVLGAMIGNINSKLFQNGNRFWSYPAWFRARTFNLETIRTVMCEQPFCHLAAGGITGAKD